MENLEVSSELVKSKINDGCMRSQKIILWKTFDDNFLTNEVP
jgi:hypothetical protein